MSNHGKQQNTHGMDNKEKKMINLEYLQYDELFAIAEELGCDPVYLVDSKEDLIYMILDAEDEAFGLY